MTKIFKDYYEFLQREDKLINGVSQTFSKEHPNWEEDNEDNDDENEYDESNE